MKVAAKLESLPTVINDDSNNFYGSYERDENGVIQVFFREVDGPDDASAKRRAIEERFALMMNEQYTVLHDNYGREIAENTEYGWDEQDTQIGSKIKKINGYSIIETMHDENYTNRRHVVTLVGNNGVNEDPITYSVGNAALA